MKKPANKPFSRLLYCALIICSITPVCVTSEETSGKPDDRSRELNELEADFKKLEVEFKRLTDRHNDLRYRVPYDAEDGGARIETANIANK